MSMLKVEDIHVYYGSIHAIKGISFEVNEGEIVTLIGANGAGKSTTLQTVSSMLRPRSGQITFMEKSLLNIRPHAVVSLGMAHCPEGRRIFQQMTVQENLEMGAYTRPKNEINDSILEVYNLFPRLKERFRQVAGTMSGGEQQMLAIGLVEEIFKIIQNLNQAGTTILLVEQNARMALSIANRGYVLETGKIIASAPASQLLEDETVKKAYLGG
ncbi:MAG: Branched-chain amino acid transport ATP-binding protein LivF [Firmicutes bacterium]|nr:Branched-chain amino acid transport ATP-binding protein LivF [Bacillota bacterium]